MRRPAILAAAGLLAAASPMGVDVGAVQADGQAAVSSSPPASYETDREAAPLPEQRLVPATGDERLAADLAAVASFRPGYAFWQHIFTIPDGSIAFGSATDGRLLAVLPAAGDWTRAGEWKEVALAAALTNERLPRRLADRREEVVKLLEPTTGPLLHNPTRGHFLLPNVQRYGVFLDEWKAIYERFGVPAEIGLAQVIVESGLHPTVRSEARAVGFCQWLSGNWKRLQRLASNPIEGNNQTTQAPYCAAYLTILATKYGSFIPALSEHHAGGTNVGRTIINGERLGGEEIRQKYFLGAELMRQLRAIAPRTYREVYGTYGPRSFFYAEMVFGNTFNVAQIRSSIPQTRIHAMRAPRALTLAEITRVTKLSADEVRRFNPALISRVPAGANLYLPSYVKQFGPEVTFWHHPPAQAYASVLDEFLRLKAPLEEWDSPAFEPVLRDFQRRFTESNTEEGAVMATVLAYTIEDLYTSRRGEILADFRSSERISRLFEQALLMRETALAQASVR